MSTSADRPISPAVWVALICAVISVALALQRRRELTSDRGATASTNPTFAKWYVGGAGFEEAVRQHQQRGVPLLVYVHTDWCGYCKQFERSLLPQAEIQAAIAPHIKARINPESSDQERVLAQRLRVTGYPTLFLMRGNTRTAIDLWDRTGGGFRAKPIGEIAAQLR